MPANSPERTVPAAFDTAGSVKHARASTPLPVPPLLPRTPTADGTHDAVPLAPSMVAATQPRLDAPTVGRAPAPVLLPAGQERPYYPVDRSREPPKKKSLRGELPFGWQPSKSLSGRVVLTAERSHWRWTVGVSALLLAATPLLAPRDPLTGLDELIGLLAGLTANTIVALALPLALLIAVPVIGAAAALQRRLPRWALPWAFFLAMQMWHVGALIAARSPRGLSLSLSQLLKLGASWGRPLLIAGIISASLLLLWMAVIAIIDYRTEK